MPADPKEDTDAWDVERRAGARAGARAPPPRRAAPRGGGGDPCAATAHQSPRHPVFRAAPRGHAAPRAAPRGAVASRRAARLTRAAPRGGGLGPCAVTAHRPSASGDALPVTAHSAGLP